MSLFFGILSQTITVQTLHRRAAAAGFSAAAGITMAPPDADTFFAKSLPIWDPKLITVAPKKPTETKIPPPLKIRNKDESPFNIKLAEKAISITPIAPVIVVSPM